MATRARKRQRAQRQRPRGSSLDEDDHLLHMDPSLMTERQQLAFLLKTTAHEASDASKASDDGSESEDEHVASPRPSKKARRIRAVAEQSPTHRGRGRPPKNKKSPRAGEASSLQLATATQKEPRKKQESKPNPSGSSDIAHLGTAQSFRQATPRCALCCDYETAYEASFSDALFLCPSCDRKYPTQQALGRMCMT